MGTRVDATEIVRPTLHLLHSHFYQTTHHIVRDWDNKRRPPWRHRLILLYIIHPTPFPCFLYVCCVIAICINVILSHIVPIFSLNFSNMFPACFFPTVVDAVFIRRDAYATGHDQSVDHVFTHPVLSAHKSPYLAVMCVFIIHYRLYIPST